MSSALKGEVNDWLRDPVSLLSGLLHKLLGKLRTARKGVNALLPDPGSIAALYQSRWRLELFFKWIKQHLPTPNVTASRRSSGPRPTRSRRRSGSAIRTYVLIAIVRKRLEIEPIISEF